MQVPRILSVFPILALCGPALAQPGPTAESVIETAIEKGVPVFNGGDHAGCARIYEEAARTLLALDDAALSPLDRETIDSALASDSPDMAARAWSLRTAFDRVLENVRFQPLIEAPLPEGFPGPGPLGRVVVKEYPRYRAARADGRGAFGVLFRHITQNDVKMTAPVETTMSDELREMDMAFLYEGPEQGTAGQDGRVRVLDLEPMTVLSVGMRGERNADATRRALALIEAVIVRDGWQRDGAWRLLGYNSPMVPSARKFWELQVPVRRQP